MIKPKLYSRPPKTNYEYQLGKSIETKVQRITENNEPITDDTQMKKFTKIIKESENEKVFTIDAHVQLTIKASSEGEAASLLIVHYQH